ncbi:MULTISPECIES: ABC transporter ATP-binding protein [Microtetraspora]|uniref:ABC transporter ATP-binding protein n=1 Tax=Microtetraspora glauca TaxID=1996 RepID=A0ABV3GDF4_MICGL|nr:ABC transporter ATP-binding protein [Microtetraspora sp. AC03309]MCC5574026.1 ABC transporter ATP-binding protein [Microtetraspora sp. AC03309]
MTSTVAAPARPVLRVRGLSWAVGGAQIVSDVGFDVAEGEFVAVIGPNGAGKTSLFNLISGLTRPTAGTIELDTLDITRVAPHRRARRGLGRTFQSSSVFPALTVAENVRLAAAAHRGACLRIWRRAESDQAAWHATAEALERVGLAHRAAEIAGSLSHGDKRKLEIAILLATDPRIILLDEPMAGVGVADVPALTEVIRAVHREQGRTVLMVEHHMDVLLGLADRVAVMHHGSLLALDVPDEVMANPVVQEAYLGEAL